MFVELQKVGIGEMLPLTLALLPDLNKYMALFL
jgi:hypothetical protein